MLYYRFAHDRGHRFRYLTCEREEPGTFAGGQDHRFQRSTFLLCTLGAIRVRHRANSEGPPPNCAQPATSSSVSRLTTSEVGSTPSTKKASGSIGKITLASPPG